MMNLDLVPRMCMTLMLTIGGMLAGLQGIDHYPGQMVALWILAPGWLFIVVYMHFSHGSELAKTFNTIDYWLRRILVVGITLSVVYTLYTGRLAETPWLTAKVALYGFLIFCGIKIRVHLPGFIFGLQALAKGTISEEENDKMIAGLKGSRPWVWSIWAVVFLEGIIGVVKPGNEMALKFPSFI
jgi:heme/copper-type cytochrome/quinol oxidase subunit 4